MCSSFNLKIKITGQTGNNGTKNVEIMVQLKYLRTFWRTLEILVCVCVCVCLHPFAVNASSV